MGTSDNFAVTTETAASGAVVVDVTGELDLATVPRVEEVLAASDRPAHLVVDLTGCTFLDSSGVRLLTRVAADLRDREGRFDLVVSDPGVLRVLEITGVDTAVAIHSTLDGVS